MKLEHLLVNFMRQAAACLRQPGVIGNLVPVRQPQKLSQRPESEQRQTMPRSLSSPSK